jgi:CheY-like chemotaxis protein
MENPSSGSQKRVVLSVEDDNAAYFLIRQAFTEIGLELKLERVVDGKDALDFLKHTGRFKDAPKPSLLLLNMNLPRMTGPELLAEMRAHELLQGIPVVVFSSSKLDADRAKCLALGAREFIAKPNTYDEFVQAIRSACSFAQAV